MGGSFGAQYAAKRRIAVEYVAREHGQTEQSAYRALGINRSEIKYEPVKLPDEDEIRTRIIYLATNYSRVGYCMVADMLRIEGIRINHKRVERIWKKRG